MSYQDPTTPSRAGLIQHILREELLAELHCFNDRGATQRRFKGNTMAWHSAVVVTPEVAQRILERVKAAVPACKVHLHISNSRNIFDHNVVHFALYIYAPNARKATEGVTLS